MKGEAPAGRNMRLSRGGIALGVLLALAFTLKLTVLLQLRTHPLLQPDAGLDTTVYVELARAVTAGNVSLGPGLYFVSPLYIYFVALLLQISSGSLFFVRLAQILLGTAAVGLIFSTADVWHGRRAAFIAAALATFTGIFTFYEVLLLQAALEPILTAAALACLAFALTRGSGRMFVASGLLFGIQTLNRPNVLLAAAGIIALLFVIRQWRQALLIAAGIIVSLVPITVRNYVVAGDLSPVSSHGGLNFYIGNNAEADGTYHMVEGITPSIAGQREDARHVAERAVGRALSDSDVSAYFYGLGWAWISDHPGAAARLLVRKLAYTFNAATLPLNYSYTFYKWDERTLLRFMPAGAWLLIPLGVLGLWLGAPADPDRRRAFAIWSSFVPFYALAVAVFFVSSRYRLPMLLPLCVTAGGAVDGLMRLAPGLRSRAPEADAASLDVSRARLRMGAALMILGVSATVANWPWKLDDGRAEERVRMAIWLIGQHRFDEAETRIAAIDPNYPLAGVMHFRVGRALLVNRQPGPAIQHLELAAKLDPDRPEVSYALGQALLDAGRAQDAVPHLRRAYEAGVRVDLAGYDLARALGATGDRVGALQVLQGVRPARNDDAQSWVALGQLALKLQAPRLAEVFLRRALQVRPGATEPHQELGLALAMMGRFEESLAELQTALRLKPSDPAAHLNVAVTLGELGRVEEARREAMEALRLRPGYEKAQQFLNALRPR